MAFVYKFLLFAVFIGLATGQYSTKRKSSSNAGSSVTTSSAGKTQYSSAAAEQGRTLGLLGPLLRLGLRGPLRGGLQSSSSALSDPAYGGYNGYNGYSGYTSGYPSNYGSYSGYSNYGQYGGYPGVGYGGGYRPPVAYPQYTGYPSTYQPQSYTGLNSLSSLSVTPNTATSSLGASTGSAASTAQQAQLATVLGQALGSSLRPLLTGAGAGRFGTSATAVGVGGSVGGGNRLAALLNLFG